MSDRTACTLRLAGLLSKDQARALAEEIYTLRPYCFNGSLSPESIYAGMLTDSDGWEFDGINEGKMPGPLMRRLTELRLSYHWGWSWGSEYSAGMTFHDARTDETVEFSVIDGGIGLTISELRQPHRIEEALRWSEFSTKMRLHVYTSTHELLSDHRKNLLPRGYIQLLGGTIS